MHIPRTCLVTLTALLVINCSGSDSPSDATIDDLGTDQSANDDATPGMPGSIAGTIKLDGIVCGTTPADDCVGALLMTVRDLPPSTTLSDILQTSSQMSVDLSGGKTVSYRIDDVRAGNVYVSAVLSEGGAPPPMTGDPAFLAEKPTAVPSGETVTLDITITSRMP